ncbi:MAG TPA: hypothetical protein VF260_07355 [Bacilli bacterium]
MKNILVMVMLILVVIAIYESTIDGATGVKQSIKEHGQNINAAISRMSP